MNKHLSSNKGFTLVEVIVVAVIVMVLAAVAIPLYQGYVRDSRKAAAEGIAATIVNLASPAVQTAGKLKMGADIEGQKVIEIEEGSAGEFTFGGGARAIIPDGYCVRVTTQGQVIVGHAILTGDHGPIVRVFADPSEIPGWTELTITSDGANCTPAAGAGG